MSIGVDIPGICNVVIYGDPEDEDDQVQKIGRSRPGSCGSGARGIIYMSPNARERAMQKALEMGAEEIGSKKKPGGTEAMD
jgi:superfamily II DNA/RNA helicase